jgi:hypothetical protein
MVSKKTPYDAFFYNFNGATEQNLLKLFGVIVNSKFDSVMILPVADKERRLITY